MTAQFSLEACLHSGLSLTTATKITQNKFIRRQRRGNIHVIYNTLYFYPILLTSPPLYLRFQLKRQTIRKEGALTLSQCCEKAKQETT